MSVSIAQKITTTKPSKKTRIIGIILAAYFTVTAVAQLFSFDEFPAMITQLWQFGGMGLSAFIAIALVVSAVFAVPYFAAIKISVPIIITSMICGWLAAIMWLVIATWQLFAGDGAVVGQLGVTVAFNNSVLILAVAVIVCVLVGYYSYLRYGQVLHKRT